MKTFWRLWAKALGEKATQDDREADYVSYIRSIIFLTYLITNLFIISGVVRHWGDKPSCICEMGSNRSLGR